MQAGFDIKGISQKTQWSREWFQQCTLSKCSTMAAMFEKPVSEQLWQNSSFDIYFVKMLFEGKIRYLNQQVILYNDIDLTFC